MTRLLPSLLCTLLLAAGVAGCGDDGPTTTTGTAAGAPSAAGAPGGAAPAAGGGTARTTTAADSGALTDDVREGHRASASEARPVRSAFRAFAKAIAAHDTTGVCERTVGFEALLRSHGQHGTCEQLFKNIGNGAAGPSAQDLALIGDADVVLSGDHATLSLGSEAPVPLRRDGGTWKVDYSAFATTSPPAEP